MNLACFFNATIQGGHVFREEDTWMKLEKLLGERLIVSVFCKRPNLLRLSFSFASTLQYVFNYPRTSLVYSQIVS